MSSNHFVLQLTCAFFVFAAATGSPAAPKKVKPLTEDFDSENTKTDTGLSTSYFDPQECIYDPLVSDVSFLYYTNKFPGGKTLEFESAASAPLVKSGFTKILTHGMKTNLSSPEIRDMIDAYLKNTENINILALDWSSYTNGMYREAVADAMKIGKMAASIFCVLYKNFDIYPDEMHFIGHGLGAHLLAATARESERRVGRLTGLDPARLCFEDYCYGLHFPQLSKNDANFVDVLHTDAGNIGVANSHGTADFYVNYGRRQPMCHELFEIPSPYCDTLTSITYYTQTIQQPFKYFAYPCTTPYPILKCNAEPTQVWGEYMDYVPTGVYHFITNSTLLTN